MAINILLHTSDAYFLNQFKFFLSEDVRSFVVYSFSDPERARDFLEESDGKIRCVLADRRFFQESVPAGVTGVVLGDHSSAEQDVRGLLSLNIYQKKQEILDDLHQILRSQQLLAGGRTHSGQAKVMSFFSTQGGSGVSSLAYLTALKGAEAKKAVYLNFEVSPCTGPFYQNEAGQSAEEFLCAVQDRGEPETTLLPALRRNEHGVYVFPTPVSLMDQGNLTEADARYILEGLLAVAEADYIIVDLAGGFGPVNQYLMSASDRVALVYGDDRVGRAKRKQFLEDPAFSCYPCAGREKVVGNRCRQKYTDGRFDVCFPQSGSLAGDVDVKLVLQGNQEIAKGCEELLKF